MVSTRSTNSSVVPAESELLSSVASGVTVEAEAVWVAVPLPVVASTLNVAVVPAAGPRVPTSRPPSSRGKAVPVASSAIGFPSISVEPAT